MPQISLQAPNFQVFLLQEDYISGSWDVLLIWVTLCRQSFKAATVNALGLSALFNNYLLLSENLGKSMPEAVGLQINYGNRKTQGSYRQEVPPENGNLSATLGEMKTVSPTATSSPFGLEHWAFIYEAIGFN